MARPRLALFALCCSLSVIGLAAMWPLLAQPYMRFVATELTLLLPDLGGGASARYEPIMHRGRPLVEAEIAHPRWPSPASAKMKPVGHLYLQAVLLLCLCVWSPVPWRRRFGATAFGLAALLFVHLLTVWLDLVTAMMTCTVKPFEMSPLELKTIHVVWEALALRHAVWLSIPVILWILLTFRREDSQRILVCPAAQPSDPEPPGE